VVGLATALDELGLGTDVLRILAIVVLVAFGATLIVPQLADRIEPLSRLQRFGPRSKGHGFWSGIGVGAALGFVYAPCAEPILAAVVSVSASRGVSVALMAVAVAYAVGSGVVLLVLALGGRRLFDRVRRAGRGLALQRATGVVLLATAAVMAFNLDIHFESYLAANAPAFLIDPTSGLEKSSAVRGPLADLRGGRSGFGESTAAAQPMSHLRDLGVAPNFTDTQRWFNTPGGRPLSLDELRGHVVLIDVGAKMAPPRVQPPSRPGSAHESYLGFERAARFVPAEPRYGVHTFTGPGRRLPLHHLAYAGTWRIGGQAVTAVRDASLDLRFRAKKVYLVLSSAGEAPRTLGLDLDGRPLPAMTVRRQRLYTLVSLPRTGSHLLRLRFPPGLSGFAFTFG